MVSTDTETVPVASPVQAVPQADAAESAAPATSADAEVKAAEATPAEGADDAEPKADAEEAPAKPARKPKVAKAASTVKKTRTVELTLTVTGTADGEWQAELTQAGKRVLQGVTVPAAAVSRAAAELHTDIAEAIESVLETAREAHRVRMAELEAELAKVKTALAELQEG